MDRLLPSLLAILAIAAVSGWVSAARNAGVADAERATRLRADAMVLALADSLSAQRARAHAASLVADSATRVADSVTAELHVTREESAATIADLRARLRVIDAGDAERAAEAEAEAAANDGWVRYERYVADTDTLRRRAELADSVAAEERAAKVAERERGDALEAENATLKIHVGELQAQVGGLTDYKGVVESQRDTAVRDPDAHQAAARSRSILPDFGDLTKPIYVALGDLLGYGIAGVRR